MTDNRGTLRAWQALWLASLVGLVWLAAAGPLPAQSDRDVGSPDSSAAADKSKSEPPARSGPIPTNNLLRIMDEGGILMYPLALCSVIGLAFVFERMVSLRRSRVVPKAFVKRFLQQVREGSLDRERAVALCAENGCPIAQVFGAASRKWGHAEIEVEQAIMDAGERSTHGLRKYLRLFTALTVIGPLLGLLGTALGMIEAFNAVASTDALGRPELLARGISRALLNTAFGLVIAIPAQTFYFYFVSRVDRLIIEMDSLGQELARLISAEGIQEKEESRGSKPRRTAKRESET